MSNEINIDGSNDLLTKSKDTEAIKDALDLVSFVSRCNLFRDDFINKYKTACMKADSENTESYAIVSAYSVYALIQKNGIVETFIEYGNSEVAKYIAYALTN